MRAQVRGVPSVVPSRARALQRGTRSRRRRAPDSKVRAPPCHRARSGIHLGLCCFALTDGAPSRGEELRPALPGWLTSAAQVCSRLGVTPHPGGAPVLGGSGSPTAGWYCSPVGQARGRCTSHLEGTTSRTCTTYDKSRGQRARPGTMANRSAYGDRAQCARVARTAREDANSRTAWVIVCPTGSRTTVLLAVVLPCLGGIPPVGVTEFARPQACHGTFQCLVLPHMAPGRFCSDSTTRGTTGAPHQQQSATIGPGPGSRGRGYGPTWAPRWRGFALLCRPALRPLVATPLSQSQQAVAVGSCSSVGASSSSNRSSNSSSAAATAAAAQQQRSSAATAITKTIAAEVAG